MIHQRYEPAFAALTVDEIAACVAALAPRYPVLYELGDIEEGSVLVDFCRAEHISQADLILSMVQDSSVAAVTAIERIMMRPIDRRSPQQVERERDAARPRPAVVTSVSASEASTDQRVIRLLVEKNPKRAGTSAHDRFARYRDGMTIAEALRLGITRGDLAWDQERSFVRVEPE